MPGFGAPRKGLLRLSPFFTGAARGAALPPLKPRIFGEMRLPMVTYELRIEMFF